MVTTCPVHFSNSVNAIIVQLLVSVHEGHECTRIQQEFIFHGATGESSNRDDAGLGRDDRWQRLHEIDRRARSIGRIAVFIPRVLIQRLANHVQTTLAF